MYQTRKANDNDYSFLFELKKSAEYEAVKAVFGWDESEHFVYMFKSCE